eukprot:TRINITY_DN79507_c0_g1_i1.p1 TRINITY_DN79507_c0_g1~~TRINITY_DN79507_c0_g1_i1.p1  ORF type:complete len:121 (+),score=15.62 TRINITY_DN79507_c0_g1_i1:61-423(+)
MARLGRTLIAWPGMFSSSSPCLARRTWNRFFHFSDASCSRCRALLGLTDSSELLERDVRRGYRAAARRLHPDRGGRHGEFQELQQCYEMLLAEARGGGATPGSPEWLKQMKKDFANFSCC